MTKFIALTTTFLLVASSLVFADVLPAEKLLPDDTLIMVTVPDFNRAREIVRNSPQGRLWNDPAMKDFRDKCFGNVTNGFLGVLQHDLGIKLNDYADLPQGQLTIAYIQNGWAGKEGQAAFLLLLDTKDKSSQLKKNLDDLKKKWVNLGKTVHTEKIRDVDFSMLMVTKADFIKPKTGPMGPGLPDALPPETTNAPAPFYIGQAGSLLIAGDSTKVIEKILARLSGAQVSTLNDLAAFDSSRAVFHDAPMFGWVNVKSFVDVIIAANQNADTDSANPFALQPDKILAATGLNAVKSVAFNCRVTDDGTEFNINLSVPESRRTGIIQILAGEAKDCAPPAFVPADAVKFQRWRFDGAKTWTTFRKIVNDISPAASGALDFGLKAVEESAKEKDPSFDINKNLFGNIGGDVVSYEKLPKSGSSDPSGPSVFLVSSPNPDQFADALRRLLSMNPSFNGAPKDREFLGHKIHTFTMPSPPSAKGAPPTQGQSLSYTTAGGYLAISSEPALIEEYLRSADNPPKPLRDLPGLSDAMQKVAGGNASLFGFSNESENMRASFESMRKNPDADSLAPFAPLFMMMNMGEVKSKDWMDVSLLPPYDRISKYFYISVYGATTTPEAINFKAFAPTPPALKK